MNVQSTIVLGILSGIITYFLIWLIVLIFKKVLVPWFESIVYKGINISGGWNSTVQLSPDQFKANLNIIIKQKGHRLKGDINAVYINTEDNNDRRMIRLKFTGMISDNNIVITYKSATEQIISIGVFLLKLHLGGEQLMGTMVSSDRVKDGIISYEEVVWERGS